MGGGGGGGVGPRKGTEDRKHRPGRREDAATAHSPLSCLTMASMWLACWLCSRSQTRFCSSCQPARGERISRPP